MEIIAPNPHSKAAFILPSTFKKDMPCKTPTLPNPIQLPLHRPQYKPPQPIKIKPLPRKCSPKPSSTTSDILRLMDSLKLPIPSDIYISLMKECTELRDSSKAVELHRHIRNSGIRLNLPLLNRILLMYVSCGCFQHARQLFDQMSQRDFNSWAVIIAGCVENGEHHEAIDLFIDMLFDKEFENLVDHQSEFSISGILVCVLKSCLYTMDLELGMQVHGWLWKMGYSRNAALCSFLVNFYGKLKCSGGSTSVFEHAPCRNTVGWTSRIVNCCSDDNFEGALTIFKEMGRERVNKNGYTFSSAIKACRRIRDIGCGQQIHATTIKAGLESDNFVQCALVDFYGNCGLLKDATLMFDSRWDKRDRACCNAMLHSYVQHGLCMEAKEILYKMKFLGFKPKESLFNEANLVCQSRTVDDEMD